MCSIAHATLCFFYPGIHCERDIDSAQTHIFWAWERQARRDTQVTEPGALLLAGLCALHENKLKPKEAIDLLQQAARVGCPLAEKHIRYHSVLLRSDVCNEGPRHVDRELMGGGG